LRARGMRVYGLQNRVCVRRVGCDGGCKGACGVGQGLRGGCMGAARCCAYVTMASRPPAN
jgi:hypothetical protein